MARSTPNQPLQQRGRDSGFPRYEVLAAGPAAELLRSASKNAFARQEVCHEREIRSDSVSDRRVCRVHLPWAVAARVPGGGRMVGARLDSPTDQRGVPLALL